jgi:hypothetical protein
MRWLVVVAVRGAVIVTDRGTVVITGRRWTVVVLVKRRIASVPDKDKKTVEVTTDAHTNGSLTYIAAFAALSAAVRHYNKCWDRSCCYQESVIFVSIKLHSCLRFRQV